MQKKALMLYSWTVAGTRHHTVAPLSICFAHAVHGQGA